MTPGIPQVLLDIIARAGEIALQEQAHLQVQTKSDGSVVTNGDLAVSQFLETQLAQLYPDHAIFSEENCQVVPAATKVIVIDPIDGTESYRRQQDSWSILVGFLDGQTITQGVVYQPTTKTFYYAAQGQGAYKQLCGQAPQPLVAHGQGPIKGIMSHKSYQEESFLKANGAGTIEHMYSAALKIMRVAEGSIDLYPNFRQACSVWDLVAPFIILTEAGGAWEYAQAQKIPWSFTTPLVGASFCAFGQRINQLRW